MLEPKKQVKSHGFCFENLTKCQILNIKKLKVSDFELKTSLSNFERKIVFRKSIFESIYTVETTNFAVLCFFKTHDFEKNFLQRVKY